ncbi:unnamed protein product [Ostreobium quekettii]|uniref:PPM-type phosphatase domain-containing protein n=1 Tax=Ostreobium quekettii TaxID=121088 RepID=A0A8S1IT72_9CHLO|nr:unnamed protein product [Ostreobium quekettii]
MKGTVVAGERGVGPLRCWPGGQAVSRSIGDIKAGESILPCPHVFQAIVPLTGARLTMASDGVWDSLHWEDAARLARSSAIGHAAAAVVNEAARRCNGPLPEDASALVLDLIPGRRGDFSKVVKERAGGADGRRWGRGLSLYSCVCGAQRPTADACAFDKLRVVATADGLEAADSETDACKRRRECGRELARGRSSEWRPVGDSALSFDTGKIVGTGSAELGLSLDDRVVVASGGSPHWPGARRAHDSAGSSPTSSDESIRADPRRGARAKRPTRSSSHSLQSIALKASNGDRPFSFLYKSPVAGGQAGSQAGGGKKATALFQLATILKRLSCEFSPERRACEAPAQGAQLRSGSQRCKTGAW